MLKGVGQIQKFSREKQTILISVKNVNTQKMKNPSIELLTVIWKTMQEEKLESEGVRQERKRYFNDRMERLVK
jgi:hypothetical protein